jgi:hypothetical protein
MAPRARGPGAAISRREAHRIYSRNAVDTFLGLLGLAAFVIVVIGAAALVTAAVVRISPTRTKKSS